MKKKTKEKKKTAEGAIVRIASDSAHKEQRGLLAQIIDPRSNAQTGASVVFLEGPLTGRRNFATFVRLSPLEQLALCAEDSDV